MLISKLCPLHEYLQQSEDRVHAETTWTTSWHSEQVSAASGMHSEQWFPAKIRYGNCDLHRS